MERRAFVLPLFLAGAVIVADQVFSIVLPALAVSTPPPGQPHTQMAMALGARMVPLLIGDTLIILALVLGQHQRGIRWSAVAHLALAVLAVIEIPLFVAQAAKISGYLLSTQVVPVRVLAARTLMALATSSVVALLLARTLWTWSAVSKVGSAPEPAPLASPA